MLTYTASAVKKKLDLRKGDRVLVSDGCDIAFATVVRGGLNPRFMFQDSTLCDDFSIEECTWIVKVPKDLGLKKKKKIRREYVKKVITPIISPLVKPSLKPQWYD